MRWWTENRKIRPDWCLTTRSDRIFLYRKAPADSGFLSKGLPGSSSEKQKKEESWLLKESVGWFGAELKAECNLLTERLSFLHWQAVQTAVYCPLRVWTGNPSGIKTWFNELSGWIFRWDSFSLRWAGCQKRTGRTQSQADKNTKYTDDQTNISGLSIAVFP